MGYCQCAPPNGWSYNPETKYWVCGSCRLPSKANGVRECIECEKLFVPVKYVEVEYEVECDNCA